MSDLIENGGPAFPIVADKLSYIANSGMTLRDYFAAKAMQGALSGCAARGEVVGYKDLTELAYEIADAMLKTRKSDG